MFGTWEEERRTLENIESYSSRGKSRLISKSFSKEQREAKDVWEGFENKGEYYIGLELKDKGDYWVIYIGVLESWLKGERI